MNLPKDMDIKKIEHREWHLWFLTLTVVIILGAITTATFFFLTKELFRDSAVAQSTVYRSIAGLLLLITLFCLYILHTRFTLGKLKGLLIDMSSMVASTVESDILLSVFASKIAHSCSVTYCQIALLNPSGNTLKLWAAYSVRPVAWKPQLGKAYLLSRIQPCAELIQNHQHKILRQKDILRLMEDDEPWELLTGGLKETHSLFITPMVTKNRVIGLAILGERRGSYRSRFSYSKITLIHALVRQASTAIDHALLISEVIEKNKAIRQANFDSIKALAEALETKDVYTRGHSDRTVAYAARLAKRLGLPEQEQDWVKYAAILHDIGKIGIPEAILNKPSTLTSEEFEVIKRHPIMGAEIVRHIKFLEPVVPLVMHDHERFDGKGYPLGLAGEAIPLGARIISVVDAFDAMTTDRPYKKAMTREQAIARLRERAGIQFDPKITDVFIQIIMQSGNNPASQQSEE